MPDRGALARRVLSRPLSVLRTRPVAYTVGVAGVVLVAPNPGGASSAAAVLLACALAYSCGAHATLAKGGVAVAALIVAMQVNMGFSQFPNVEILFPTLVPFWVGYQVRLRSSLVSRLAERTRELHQEHAAFAALAVRRERARIARELHDIVAHHLAVVVVQAGAGRMATLGATRKQTERFVVIRQSCDQALAEMARLVDILHTNGTAGSVASDPWRRLVDHARAGGVKLRITPLPLDAPLPPEIEAEAYRIVREGLTNTIKHAPGAEVEIRLRRRDHDLEIEVHDHGPRTAARAGDTGAGLGLIGVRERVESIGGTLEAGPGRDGGWRLRATLPVAPSAVIPAR
jgi:signal transduction histidine kinase